MPPQSYLYCFIDNWRVEIPEEGLSMYPVMNEKRRLAAKQLIADHDQTNFYSFRQRVHLLSLRGNYMAGLADLNDPGQVGDLICELDNSRIPFKFDPKTSALLVTSRRTVQDIMRIAKSPTVDDNVREMVLRIMNEGVDDETRTGIRSRAIDSVLHTYDISRRQIPALSSKYTWVEGVKVELVWMISGDTNIRFLKQHKVGIWDSWVKPGTEEYRTLTFSERQELAKKKGFIIGEDPQGGFANANIAMDQLGIPRQELVAGELPRIYQHQWRGWADTKYAHGLDEANAYIEKGYSCEGFLDSPRLGPVTVMYREIDQLKKIIDQLKNKPDDRGIILSAWNVGDLDEMALRPCHTLCQFFSKPMSVRERLQWLAAFKPAGFEHMSQEVLELATEHDDLRHETQLQQHPETLAFLDEAGVPKRKLSSLLYMRSNDVPLGHPFNIVQYAMLTHMVAQVVGMATDTFTYVGGDCHIYENQWPGVLEWLEQEPREDSYPTIELNPHVKDLFEFKVDDISVSGYKHSGKVKFPKAAV